jgi:hypothetical protein
MQDVCLFYFQFILFGAVEGNGNFSNEFRLLIHLFVCLFDFIHMRVFLLRFGTCCKKVSGLSVRVDIL